MCVCLFVLSIAMLVGSGALEKYSSLSGDILQVPTVEEGVLRLNI